MQRPATIAVAILAFLNGLVALGLPVVIRVGHRPNFFGTVLPFGLHHWGRLLTPLFGLLLIYLAFHLWRRRRVAWWTALIAATFAIAAHLVKGDAPLALGPAVLLGLLLYSRPSFTVRSDPWTVLQGSALSALVLLLALGYGLIGFAYLDDRDFEQEISFQQGTQRMARQFALVGNPDLHPRTRHARWFLESLEGVSITSLAIVMLSVGLPLRNRYRVEPRDREDVRRLLERYGGTSVDYFKL